MSQETPKETIECVAALHKEEFLQRVGDLYDGYIKLAAIETYRSGAEAQCAAMEEDLRRKK